MSDINNGNSRIAKNTIYLTLRLIVVLAINLYVTRVVLNTLGVVDYGVYNAVCGIVAMLGFLNTSMSNGAQRFYNFEYGKSGEEGVQKVYITSLVIQSLVAVLLILFAETIGLWYLNNKIVVPVDRLPAAKLIYQFSIVSFVFVIMQAPYTAAVMAHERMNFYAIVSVLDAVLKLVIVWLLPLFDMDKLILYGVLLMLINIFNFFIYFIYNKINFKSIRLGKRLDTSLFKSMLSFSGWNVFGSLAGVGREQGVDLVLNFFCGPIVNAARGVAAQVNGGVQNFVANLTIAIRPQVVQSYAQGNIHRTLSLTYSISKLSCCIIYLLGYPIILEIHYILNIWLDGTIPEHTESFVAIIILTSIISNLNSAVSGVVHASGKMKYYQISGASFSLLSVLVAFICMKYGLAPESAIWSIFFCTLLGQVAALLILKTIVNYSLLEYVQKIILPFTYVVGASFLIPLVPRLLMDEGLLRFGIVFLLSVVSGSIAVYFLGMNKDEKQLLYEGLLKRIFKN